MEITPDVVATTATKINFDKRFLVGVVVGASVVGAANVAVVVKKKIDERKAAKTEVLTAE